MGTAVVVGAGVAGLASAVALHNSGWSVRVLEQQPVLRASGTSVVLHRAAITGLRSLGLGPDLDALTVPLTGLQARTRASTPLSPVKRSSASLLIQRSALVSLLQRALPDSAVTYGEAMPARELPQLRAEADLVVAADGVDSALRRELFGQRYAATTTGTTVWRGTARTTTAGLTEYWGQGRRFGASDRPGGGTNWYATAVLPSASENVTPSKPVELERLFGQWCQPVTGVLASIDREAILRHEIRHISTRLPRYYRGTVVLVGDAAHAMTPDLGRGANEAILDALTLARKLRHQPLERALAAYDRSRRPRTQLIAAASAAVDAAIHRRSIHTPVG